MTILVAKLSPAVARDLARLADELKLTHEETAVFALKALGRAVRAEKKQKVAK